MVGFLLIKKRSKQGIYLDLGGVRGDFFFFIFFFIFFFFFNFFFLTLSYTPC
jgi:hypothetical protein